MRTASLSCSRVLWQRRGIKKALELFPDGLDGVADRPGRCRFVQNELRRVRGLKPEREPLSCPGFQFDFDELGAVETGVIKNYDDLRLRYWALWTSPSR